MHASSSSIGTSEMHLNWVYSSANTCADNWQVTATSINICCNSCNCNHRMSRLRTKKIYFVWLYIWHRICKKMYKLNYGVSLSSTTTLRKITFISGLPSFKSQGEFIISGARLKFQKWKKKYRNNSWEH